MPDYKGNISQIYTLLKNNGATKQTEADFAKDMTDNPNARLKVYGQLKKWGTSGIGNGYNDFAKMVSPNAGGAKPKPSATSQQAAEVGQTMFGGGEETTALQQAQQQVQQIQQANKEPQGQTREHLDNPQMQSLFGYKNMSNSRVVNDDSLWDENGMLRRSGQPSIEEGERKAKENIGNVYESLVNGKGTRIDEKGRLRSNDPLAALQQERSERNAKAADATREEVKNTVGSVMADADKRFFDTYKSLIDNNHLDEQAAISVANQEISPEKVLEEVRSKVSENATKMILSNMATYEKAAKEEGITTEEYISKYVMPEISAQVEQEFDNAQMSRYMPQNAGEFIVEGLQDSIFGTLANMAVTTQSQRQYQQRATEEAGEKYGMGARLARMGVGFAGDAPVFAGTGKLANTVISKVGLGSIEKTVGKTMADRYLNFVNANLSRAERFASRATTGMAHGAINMGAYEGINGVVQTLNNGDTSLAGLGAAFFHGIRHGAVTGVAMGGVGSLFGELGSRLGARPGLSRGENFIRATDKAAFQMLGLVGEGFSMHLGEQINSQIEGTGFNLTWEGTLENAIMAGVMKISSPSHYKSFKKNVASMFLAEPKDNPIRLSDDDKRELMKVTGSSSMEEVMTKIFPDGEKAEGNATNAQITEAQTRYLEIMNSLSWDAQNKISVALTGTACSARPRTGRFEADGNILYEYANDGTLLSTHEFKNAEEKNAYVYQKRLHQENVDFWGTYGKALLRDKDAVITAMTDIARQNGVQDEFVIKAMEKEPIRRTQGEREVLRQIEEALHEMAFPKGEVHTEQSAIDGEKAAQDAEVTSDEPKTEVVNNTNVEVTQVMADFVEAMKDAVWKEDYEELKKQGMSDADIYNTLMEQYNEAELAPLADYVNAQAKQQGFMQGVANEIEQKKSEQTNLVTSGKVTINGVERTDGRVITLVDADGNIVRLLSGDFKLNEDGTIETEQPIIVSDDNGNPRPLNNVDGWKVAGSTDAGEYASYIRELLGQKATAVIDPNGEFAQPAPTEAPKETPKAETEPQRNESEGTAEPQQPQVEKPKAEVEAPKAEPQQPVAEESKPAPQAESEPTEAKKDGIPLDENGKKNYVADGVRPVDAVNDIYNRGVFNTEQADAYVQSKIEEARKAYDKVNKDIAPKKGEDPDDYLARLQAHDAEVTAAKQVLDRWQAIYDEAHKFDAKEEEAEDVMKTDDIDMRGLEDDPRYFIATHMLKITPESFNEQVGLGAREKRAMPGFLAKKENGGVSIFEATDHIMQFLKDQGITVDEDFVKNTIIDILTSGGPRSYIKNMREEFLANVSREEAYERAKMDKDYLDNYGMEYDEYKDYLEAERQRVSELYRGVDEDAFYARIAEERQEYDKMVADHDAELKEIEETLNSKKNGEETGRTDTGIGLLHQEEARKEGRAGEMPDETGKLQSGDRVQDKDGLVPKEASGRKAVENPSTEETKAETPKVDRLNDTSLSAEERIKGEKPLTEQEIDSLPDELFNDVVKTQIRSALEKLGNGDKLSALEELFYLNALKHVRTTTERGAENSTDANGAQLADGDNARSSNGGEGGETGNVAGKRGGETPEEQLRGQDSEGDLRTTARVRGDREVRGGEPADDGVSTAGMESESGSGTGRNGSDVRKPKGEGAGSTTSGEATRDEIQSSIEARKKKLAELAKRIKKTPKNTPPRLYDAASALGAWIGKQIDSVDFVAVGEFSKETMLLGGDYLRLGIHDFKEWAKRVKGELGDLLKDTFDWKDAEVDDFIREMWNSKYEMDGETHTIAEWASILGDRELRKEISRSLDEKRQLQKDAENIEVKVGDKDNIDQTLPFLLPEQRGDVLKAETAFFGEKHQDRTHGYGKGMMFTNGTGTGKTYTGLGIVKRFVKQGKGRVLIVTPSQPKVADWVKDGQNLGLEVTPLENTKDAGNGVVCTTYANLRANEAVLRDTFDLIVYDESHKIMENKKGEETIGTAVHYQLSNKNKQHAVERVKMKYEPFRKEKELRQELDDTRNIQENAINKLRELDISLPKHPTNSAEIDEHIRAIEQEGENVEGNKEKLNYLRIARNAFNRLGEIPREIEALKPEQEKLMPEIEKEAEEAVKRTKSVFLSATPFNTRESLKYAEGYLFSYPEENKNTVGTYNHRSPEQAFLEQHFSAGYRWRYGRLEQHMENAEALAKQEVRFSDYLQDQLGTLSTRQIDNGYDYSRTFPTVTLDKAEAFNQALQDVFHDKTMQPLWEAFHDVFYDYNKQTALFETMKTALAAERIREHLARGRKVVVFHRRRTTKDELHNPFQQALTIAKVNSENMSAKDKQKVADAIAAFHGKYGDLLKWEQGLDYRLPREQLADIFGEDKVAFFSGEETTKQKNQSIDDFMKDNKGKDIIVIQEASGKEGISLHDQTGEHQRVQISLCLPQSPIAFIQSEGRIYRIGQKSNAVFEYPLLGLNLEINLWAHKFNNALGTTEYLAMGSKARNLSESIAKGIMENSGTIGFDDAGVGGKAYDGNVEAQTATGFDGAITDYFTNQKISAKRENREGADYFPTPEPVGYKMVEWAGLTEGESALEPSAGHGAIARYVPKSNNLTMIEPSQSLMSKLVLNTPGSGRKYEGGTFEDYNVINKHDAIVMNPPYGAGGTTAVEHVAKGFKHLNEGGRLIAIIPDGPACDKKMQKWLESKDAESAVITGEIKLPSCTFGRAGTAVNTRIVVIDKVTREEVRNGMPTRKEVDLRSVTDVNELFEKMRDIDMPERTIDKEYLREKAAKNFRRKIADPDSANKFVVSFVEANQKFVRIDFKRGGVSLWIDVEEIQNNKDEALRSYRRIKERYDTADASFRANRIFTMGRGSNKVEIREADIKRDIYQNAMEFVAKVAGTTVKELDTRNNELMERLRNGSKPTEQPQTEVKPQESRWDYSVVKHTQTGADLHIVKSKERMTDEEYRKELAKAKELGGFYDRYSKGFRFETKENADKFMQSKESSSVKTDVRETMKDYMPEKEISEIEERTNKEVEENLAQIPDEYKKDAQEELDALAEALEFGVPMSSTHVTIDGKEVMRKPGLQEIESIILNDIDKYEVQRNLCRIALEGNDMLSEGQLEKEIQQLQRSSEISLNKAKSKLAIVRREIAYETAKQERLSEEFGISENGEIHVNDVEKLFSKFNSDEGLNKVFDVVAERLRELSMRYKTNEAFEDDRTSAAFAHGENTIILRSGRLLGSHTDKQATASDILHEMIHPLTSDPIRLYEMGGKYRDMLNPEQQRVAKEVIDLFNKLKKNEKDFLDENGELMYGLSKPTEFLNEAMSDLAFRERLKGKGVWGKIKEWVKSLFGISDMQKAEKLFNDLLRTYDLRNKENKALYDWVTANNEKIWNNEPQAKKIDASDKDLTEDDKKAIADLNSGDKEKTKTVYRAMQVIDGKLYPPMAARIEGELVEGAKSGDILKADEHPELIKMIDGKPKFVLDKGGNDATGKKASNVPARYNPYWHTSNSPMNDQFKSAWIRPNMVTVECEIPVSELTSGYKAEFAKDAVGMVPWKSGSVTGELVKQGHPGREVYLSRYCKIGRVLSDAETAEKIKEFIGDKDVSVPENVVTPKVRQELEKLGVKIGAPEKGVKKSEQVKEAIANGLEVDNTTRFSEDLDDNLSPSEEKKEYPFVWNRKKKALANIFRSATLEEAGSDVTEYLENHTDLFKGLSGSDEEVLKTINDMSETEYKEMRKVADAVYVPSYDEFHKMDASEQMEYVDDFRMKARGAREENLTSAKWLEENAPELISSIKFNDNNGERITAEQVRKMFGWDESVGIDDLSTEIDVDKLQTIVNSEKEPNTRFSEDLDENNKRETALRDALIGKIREAGIDVVTDEKEGQRVLDMVNSGSATLSKAQKRAVETASLIHTEGSPADIPTADIAKVQNNLETLAKKYDNLTINNRKNFLDEVAKEIGATEHGSKSKYVTIEAKNGDVVTIRLANHNSKVSTFDKNDEDNGISIVVSKRANEGITNDGSAHIVEYFYPEIALRRAEGKPLADIVRAIQQSLYSGEFNDPTGLAERQEVNNEQIRQHKAFHGSGADFDAFDHSHMGEGEGAQAYGWGTYLTEVEGIGKTYARSMARKPIGARPVLYKGKPYEKASQDVWSDAKKEVFDELVERQKSMGKSARVAKWDLLKELDHTIKQSEHGVERSKNSEEKWQKAVEYLEGMTDEQFRELVSSERWKDFDGDLKFLKYAINDNYDLGRGGVMLECEKLLDISKQNQRIYANRQKSAEAKMDALKEFDDSDFSRMNYEATLYTVDIPDDNGTNYLVYDAKMEQQPEQLEAIGRGLEKLGWKRNGMTWSNATHKVGFELAPYKKGSAIYEALSGMLGSKKAASEFLHSVGVTGIKFPAEFRSGGREDDAMNYVIFNENDAKISNKVKFFRTAEGTAYGFVKDGKIYIDPRIATSETPVHEYSHLWTEALRKNVPEKWEQIKRTLLSDESVKPFIDKVRSEYSKLTDENDLLDEVLAQYSGKRGAERLREIADEIASENSSQNAKAIAVSALAKVRNTLNEFWRSVADMFGWKQTKASDIADKMLSDLFNAQDLKKLGKQQGALDNPTHERMSEGEATPQPEDKPTVRAHIDTVSKDLNTPCEVHNDASTIKNEKVRKAIESGRKVKGWWDKDGVHLYMPNIHSRHDAETTILHETVGHDGLRKLMNGKDGKSRNFQKFLDMVWADKKNTALHEFVKEYAPKNGWDLHEAVDEWLAREAEKPVTDENFGMWGRVKAMFNNALRALGFKSDMSLNDVRYAIWLSKRMKQKPNDPLMKARAAAFRWGMEHSNYKPEVKDGRYVDSEDGKDETRLAASLTPLHTACVQEYNRLLDSRAFRTHEAFTDSMNSLRILQELISGKNYYDIKDSENAYIAENHASSKSEAAWNKFKVQLYQPLEAAINECVGLFGGNPTETIGKMEDYGMKKHGLERNRKLFVRDAIEAITDANAKQQMTLDWDNERHRLSAELMSGKIDYREYLEGLDNFISKNIDSSYDPNKNDYSGISAYDPNRIKRGRKVEYDENAIIDDVMDMETLLGDKAQNFWDAVKQATDFAVDYSYETGMIDSKSQDHIKDMFDFYLPLRGFNEETMEDVYDYIGGRGNGADLPIRNAKGRLSEAESPLAHIAKMAMTSITRGEDNKVRQMFYRLVANHPSDAAKVSDVWEVKTKDPVTGNETWEVTLPDIPTDATPKEIADIMDNFEALMEAKKGSGEARKAKSRPNYGRIFENKAHASQHIVRTSINGKPKMVYVLGNPRAAQALNGEVVNKNNSRIRKWIIDTTAKLATSYSPEFILSNTSKDTLFANANIASKESAAYYAKFTKNQAIAGARLSLTGVGGDRWRGESLFEKYYRGHIDTSKPMEKMFAEFMDNGGRTGYVAIQDIEKLNKNLKASIKRSWLKAAIDSVPKGIEQMNMRAELINRFATFMTSRQMGRSIQRSVADAKEVSVNFNRKGAGNATEGWIGAVAGALRNNFMFFNAGMQSAELLYRNMKGMDSKAIKTTLFMGAVPAAVGTAFAMFLASQEDEEYSNIPSWDRRNNICIPIKGEGYIKIPLPYELRAFWGMGDIIASLKHKRLQTEESPEFAMCGQITQMLPIDILESGQMNLTDPSGYSPLLPTYVQPLYQYVVNESWTGKPIEKESKFNPDAPHWTRAYSSTNPMLVEICKFAHDTFREGENTAQETDTTGDSFLIDPSLYDYLLKSYFGGAYSMLLKSTRTLKDGIVDGEWNMAHAPMASRLWGGFSEKEADATTNAKFWAYKREADNVAKEFSNAANKTNPMAITELKETSRGKRYAIYKSADKELQYWRKIINHSDNPDKVAEAEREQKKLRRDLVDALDNVE